MTKSIPPQAAEFTQDVINRQISQHAFGRSGRTGDIDNAAVLLASKSASFITGEALAISGNFPII